MRKPLIALLVAAAFAPTVAGAQNERALRFRDGRAYAQELARRLDVPNSMMTAWFSQVRLNLPRDGSVSSLSTGIESMARLAHEACAYAAPFFDGQGFEGIRELYGMMLDREPTPAETERPILGADGQPSAFAACMTLALHPEFISYR